MKTFYEDWPETFVSRLDMLRALDDRGSTRRLYLEEFPAPAGINRATSPDLS